MKTWIKVLVAVIGSGVIGGLTYGASINPTWGMVFTYISMAVSGTMGILIGWPKKDGA